MNPNRIAFLREPDSIKRLIIYLRRAKPVKRVDAPSAALGPGLSTLVAIMGSNSQSFDLRPGTLGHQDLAVDDSMMMGKNRVFPLARLAGSIEQTAMSSVQPQLPPGWTTVGFEIKVELMELVRSGITLAIRTELKSVKGTHLLFDVSVFDGERRVAAGLHRRTVVSMRA
jgi:predicted thioesterase